MSDVDVAPARRPAQPDSGADGIPSSLTDPTRHPRTKASLRDVVMKRDRSRDSRDGSRGRGRPDPTHRGSESHPHSRPRSSSPGSRFSQGYRSSGREKKYHRSEAYRDNGDHRRDDRRHGRSSDRRDPYPYDTRRGKTSSARYPDPNPSKRRDGSSSPANSRPPFSARTRDRSFSPASRKRIRSRSPLPSSRSKRSKRDRDRDRDSHRRTERDEQFEHGHSKERGYSKTDRAQSPAYQRSVSPHYKSSHRRYTERADHPKDHRPRRRSRSQPREVDLDDRPTKPPRPHDGVRNRDSSHSPPPMSRRSSASRTHSPRSVAGPLARDPEATDVYSQRASPSAEQTKPGHPPYSPKDDHSSRWSRMKPKYQDEPRPPKRGPLASGANSIEVGTSWRTDRRPSFEESGPSDTRANHPRDLEASSHSNPKSPLSHPEVSPQPHPRVRSRDYHHHSHSQHPPRDRSFPRPTSATGGQRSSQSPPRSPADRLSQTNFRGRGFSRGGFRGGLTSARGGHNDHGSSRHGQRPTAARPMRDAVSPSDHTMPVRYDTPNLRDEDEAADTTSRPPRGQNGDHSKEERATERATDDQASAPRPPSAAPTGPAGSKFSFAFKTSNKNPVTAPKPEISQKFSAAPKRESHPIIDDRDRDLPKDTPREPASARARADYHHNRHAPPPPPQQPRTRKVMKTRRKLKPKPPLEPELAKSTSVYFRKPGNESVIGSGTYGKVFKGRHAYTQKLVALKRIRMEGERDGFPVTAMREIKLLQSFKHANIVDLHEVMIEKNECYMVFEYLSHDLTGLLNHPTYKIDAAQKKHLALQMFEGLDYLHKRGVLHRDIKAANILVSNDGILKLADFGLARFYAKRHQLDYTNRVITIWYRSPELLLGETQYGAAVDIWSAACVLVEIFTRHAIFPGDGGEISQLEKIYNILGTPNRRDWPGLADTPWFELLRPGYRKPNVFAEKYKERVPADAFDLLAEMFHYDPVKRPSAADVLEHPYFTVEQPPPRQAVELKDIKGDWHEFESKALRREKEKQDKQAREARRAAENGKDKKRPPSAPTTQPDSKRQHLEGKQTAAAVNQDSASTALLA